MEGPPGNSARRARLLLCGEKKLPGGDSGSGSEVRAVVLADTRGPVVSGREVRAVREDAP